MFWFLPMIAAALGAGAGAKRAGDRGENPWTGALKGAAMGAAAGFGGAALGGGAAAGAGAGAAGTGASTAAAAEGVGAATGTVGAAGSGVAGGLGAAGAADAAGAGSAAAGGAASSAAAHTATQAFMQDLLKEGGKQAVIGGAKYAMNPPTTVTSYAPMEPMAQQNYLYWGQ